MLEKSNGSEFEKIRPKDVLENFLKLVREDLNSDSPSWVYEELQGCAACESKDIGLAFKKWGESYFRCRDCASLFMNPRPKPAELNSFYAHGKSSEYWSDQYYPRVAENRRASVYRKRAAYAADLLKRFPKDQSCIVDIGTGFGIFLEELKNMAVEAKLIGVEPYPPFVAVAESKGLDIVAKWLEELQPQDLPTTVHLMTLFEVAEHLQNPRESFDRVAAFLPKGGMLFFTTLGADGFDVQELGEDHENIYPPCHINILSQRGYERLLAASGFRIVEITTPGILDVSIVKRTYENQSSSPQGFVKTLLQSADDSTLKMFQSFLQETNRSSHMWIVAEKI